MSSPKAVDILNREFLEMRAKVLELAASLDRMDRADGDVADDRRMRLLQQGIQILAQPHRQDRAEQTQLLFSREYDPQWKETFRAGKAS